MFRAYFLSCTVCFLNLLLLLPGDTMPPFSFYLFHLSGLTDLSAVITFSAISTAGCGVYPRPKREGVKPSPTVAETMIKSDLSGSL